ncbi:unnamed protein product [Phytophthora fragariaefolia]|uniref:Unnamed protein product n=1 Tax=Phytophthora fragariaefolia TaxID=1490495 RepID=A0A9W7CUE4_9STRA|nr:unnamed protein product [Phytophthora fragariaefolia]
MGCHLTTLKPAIDPNEQGEAKPIRVTDTPSNVEDREAPELGVLNAGDGSEVPDFVFSTSSSLSVISTSSSLSVIPPTVTSQISDLVDLCAVMQDGDVKLKSEAVFERVLRAQYRLEELGDKAPDKVAELLSELETLLQEAVKRFAGNQDTAVATVDALEDIDSRLSLLNSQLDKS